MKVFKFIYKATFCAALSATALTSCVNNWLDLEPSDGVEENAGITSSDNLGTAIAGLYAGVKGNNSLVDYYGARMFLYGDVHADDMQSNEMAGTNSNRASFYYLMQYNTGTSFSGNAIWQSPYIVIGRANRIIAAADGGQLSDKDEAAATIADYKSQALVLRALALFDLARVYGKPYTEDQGASLGVPFTKEVIASEDIATTQLPRLTVKENYTQVLEDLNAAISSNALSTDMTPGYVNLWTAKALLSRVYLNMGDWKNALEVSEDIINNSPYELWTKDQYAGAWYKSNAAHTNEMIFEISINDNNDWTDRVGIAYLTNENCDSHVGYSDVVATKSFVDMLASDPQDVRNKAFLPSEHPSDIAIYGENRVWLNKMPAVNGDPRYSNVPMMRLSEVYLTAAECAFNLGDKATAAKYLNAIIENRTSDESKVVTAEDITADRIYIERRKELVGEGQRYFDCLRRNETIVRYTSEADQGWHQILTPEAMSFNRDDFRAISAIPQSEINANPNIKQNEGYGE